MAYNLPPLEIYGVDDDGVEHRPLKEVVAEARRVERPAIICKKIDVLARSNEVSITMTFEPTIDIDARATAKFVMAMTKQLREMGFDTKDAPRPASTYTGQRGKKPEATFYLRSDGSNIKCKACDDFMLISQTNGGAYCRNYRDKTYQHHTNIQKGNMPK